MKYRNGVNVSGIGGEEVWQRNVGENVAIVAKCVVAEMSKRRKKSVSQRKCRKSAVRQLWLNEMSASAWRLHGASFEHALELANTRLGGGVRNDARHGIRISGGRTASQQNARRTRRRTRRGDCGAGNRDGAQQRDGDAMLAADIIVRRVTNKRRRAWRIKIGKASGIALARWHMRREPRALARSICRAAPTQHVTCRARRCDMLRHRARCLNAAYCCVPPPRAYLRAARAAALYRCRASRRYHARFTHAALRALLPRHHRHAMRSLL